jgi:hypothetical protein
LLENSSGLANYNIESTFKTGTVQRETDILEFEIKPIEKLS